MAPFPMLDKVVSVLGVVNFVLLLYYPLPSAFWLVLLHLFPTQSAHHPAKRGRMSLHRRDRVGAV